MAPFWPQRLPMTAHKLNLRLPMHLIEAARVEAEAAHVSLNTYILQAVEAHVTWTASLRAKQTARTLPAVPVSAQPTGQPLGTHAPEAHGAPATGVPGRVVPKVGSKQPCPCGSGKPYGKCHGRG